MKSSPIGRRYGKALLDLAEEQKQTERVSKDLADVADTWTKSRELRDLFENPKVPLAARKQALGGLLDRMAVAPLLKTTLLLLAERGRLRNIPEIAAAFQELAELRAGKLRAEVTTAVPMPDAYYAEIQKAIETATGRKVVVVKNQDPSIIAGVVTRVGDKVFDGSLKARLREMREQLLIH